MADLIKLIECPRDAWQGLPDHPGVHQGGISEGSDRRRIQAHRCRLVCLAQGRPANGRLRDVMRELDPPDDVEIIGIVVNERAPSAPSQPKPCARWAFPIRCRQLF